MDVHLISSKVDGLSQQRYPRWCKLLAPVSLTAFVCGCVGITSGITGRSPVSSLIVTLASNTTNTTLTNTKDEGVGGMLMKLGWCVALVLAIVIALYIVGYCVGKSIAAIVKVSTRSLLGAELSYDKFRLSWCNGFRVHMDNLKIHNPQAPKDSSITWGEQNLLKASTFTLTLDLCGIICSRGKKVNIKELTVEDVSIVYDKPNLMDNSNCEFVTENLNKLDLPAINLPLPDKMEIHKVGIKGIKAKAVVKGVPFDFILADIEYPDMMDMIEPDKGGKIDAKEATVIIAEVTKIVFKSLMASTVDNVSNAASGSIQALEAAGGSMLTSVTGMFGSKKAE